MLYSNTRSVFFFFFFFFTKRNVLSQLYIADKSNTKSVHRLADNYAVAQCFPSHLYIHQARALPAAVACVPSCETVSRDCAPIRNRDNDVIPHHTTCTEPKTILKIWHKV